MDVLAFIWRALKLDPRRFRRLAFVTLGATLLLLVGVITIRVLAARNVPEVAPLLGTLDVVSALLALTFFAQLVIGAVNFEILRLEAQQDENER